MTDMSPQLSNLALEEDASPWGDEPSRSTASPANAPAEPAPEPGKDVYRANLTEESPPQPKKTASAPRPAARGPRTPRRAAGQVTKLEAVDDPLGPLGGADEPEASTTLEQPPSVPSKEAGQKAAASSVEVDDDGLSRRAPPVQPASPSTSRQTQPSVSIEQAANPKFDIAVGDPHKVGDLTSSHIVYNVRTKTTSKAYKQPEFAVTRRYRDFLWLFGRLHDNNPGVIVPPPPEKQAVGRFGTEFVESRRQALEKMLNKTAAHPILQHDADLKIFLESEAFNMDVKHKEKQGPGLSESKGMFGSLGGAFSGGSTKFIETDDWFRERRIYLDALKNQLKALEKAVFTVIAQKRDLAEAAGDFSASLSNLSTVELSSSLSSPLEGLAELQTRIQELNQRQAQQDELTLGITADEYLRLISSIEQSFASRQKAFTAWHNAESELQKQKQTQEKILRSGKTQGDRINQLKMNVDDAEKRVHQARVLYDDVGRTLKMELERFEKEKVEDFKSGVETFLEQAVEAQKELIEMWESFLMRMEREDAGEEPFWRGVPISSLPAGPSKEDSPTPGAQGQDTTGDGAESE